MAVTEKMGSGKYAEIVDLSTLDPEEIGYKIGSKVLWGSNIPMGPEFTQKEIKRVNLEEGVLARVSYINSIFLKVEIANKQLHRTLKNAPVN